MKKRPSVEEELQDWRQTFAHNLRHWLYERFPNETNKPVALAEKSGVGKSSINRWLHPEQDEERPYSYPTMEKIIRLAHGLNVQPYDLILDAAGSKRYYQSRGKDDDLGNEAPGLDLKRR